MSIIKFDDVWENYRIKFIIDGKTVWENFWALKEINFELEKGQTLGIIGENGAGKSTILKLIMGMLKPDKGKIEVSGKVAGLLELGAGFQTELTGKENIYLSSALFGLTQTQIEEKYKKIESFASIGKFINAALKYYSQGMFVRLAFAIAIHSDPDILLIDDTLAVGDEYFQRKCIKKIFELKEQNKAIVFVTHDMSMLNRLCERALFLKEGRLIKDDVIDNVSPLYTQMIGVKEGVGTLEKRDLRLVFNNGRLFLNWKDKLLTPNSGAHAVFLMDNKWHSSFQADWEVKRDGDYKLVATGKFYQLEITQVWRLEITDDSQIKWDIEMDSEEPTEIQEGCTNIMLTDAYTKWFTALEKGEFPLIEDTNKNWQPLLDGNISRKCVGVMDSNIADSGIPSLVLEQSNVSYRTQGQIFNTDYLANCRILQFKTVGLQNYSGGQASYLPYFSGKIILDIPDVEDYLKRIEDEFVLSKEKLKLIFDNGKCILCYNGLNLTKASHINTSFYAQEKWFSSGAANWDVKKEGKNRLIAYGNWPGLPLTQIWEIEITGEDSFSWKVSMQVHEELNIEQQFICVISSSDYTRWFSDYGTGNFPDNFLEIETDILQRCIPDGIIGVESQNNEMPALSLKFSKGINNFAKIFNSNFYNKTRILQVEKVEPEQNVKFPPGTYPSFALEFSLSQERRVQVEDLANILERGKLKFVFDNGRGRIYWDGQEITKRLGLYTSLRSQGRWYDSASSALWKTEAKTNDTIEVSGKWLHLPIRQYWEMRLTSDKLIEFIVTMKVDNDIEVDRLQTNIMLSERYSQWFANDEKRIFPKFSPNIDDDWEVLWSGFANGGKDRACIGVEKIYQDGILLPAVIFSPQEICPQCALNVVNSDIYHRGRVLQYLKKEQESFSTGEYIYYQGRIEIKDS